MNGSQELAKRRVDGLSSWILGHNCCLSARLLVLILLQFPRELQVTVGRLLKEAGCHGRWGGGSSKSRLAPASLGVSGVFKTIPVPGDLLEGLLGLRLWLYSQCAVRTYSGEDDTRGVWKNHVESAVWSHLPEGSHTADFPPALKMQPLA